MADKPDVQAGANIHAAPIRVSHAGLEPSTGTSSFMRECPVCKEGLLAVRRDDKTGSIRNLDRCLLCGQQVIYTDATIAGQAVVVVA